MAGSPFPVNGVIGIVANNIDELRQANEAGLSSIEVRADLLLKAGLSVADLLSLVRQARDQGLNVLFTLRHPSHGGVFEGSEEDRLKINLDAIEAGAEVVDAEWDLPVSSMLLEAGAPVLLSCHNFERMLSSRELEDVTARMSSVNPLGLKVVPTASSIADATDMLEWVSARTDDEPHRIGFAMGPLGATSRILTIAFGAPITYAAFGESVAPGQIALNELVGLYRAHELNAETRCFGIAGTHTLASRSPHLHNPALHKRNINAVYLPLQVEHFDDLLNNAARLRLDGMGVTIPFKEAALAASTQADDRSKSCGASNTLVYDRSRDLKALAAYNTDFDGVLTPIKRLTEEDGLRVAVIGNGGAARGAVDALRTSGAHVKLFFRNSERGAPVAAALGVEGATLDALPADYDVYINATPLGTQPDDPSPVPANVFSSGRSIAFEMIYQNPDTRFLKDAREAGAPTVEGMQMLVAQAVEQFRHLTGESATVPEFETYSNASW